MRKTTNFWIYLLLIMGVFIVVASSCKKDKEDDTTPPPNTNGNNGGSFTCGNNFTDFRNGTVYTTVQIGTQCWTAKNLAYAPSSGNFWSYNNNNSNVGTYGYLYDWATAINICPTGWHLPSDAEWKQLTDFLGGTSVAGGKLKETGTTHWNSPNTGATNETGFTALPGGFRAVDGNFFEIGLRGGWWSSTEHVSSFAYYRRMENSGSGVDRNDLDKELGFSVRCVRDL